MSPLPVLLNLIRKEGGMVAVHNDYKMNGEFHTFWLFTFPDGTFIKGEGKTDVEALALILGELKQEDEPSTQYQMYLPSCDCGNGIIIKDGKLYCRWCRTPYGEGAMINYKDSHFKQG